MDKTHGAVIVSWDFTHGRDVGVLLVGKQTNGRVDIINAFQGDEAYDIYDKLTTKKAVATDGKN